MDKKGAELSFNVIIIAILVILVLVIVASVFVGGFGKLTEILFGNIDNLETATTTCTTRCLSSQSYSTERQKLNSAYCTRSFNFDYNPKDGKSDRDLEGNLKNYYCYQAPISVSCPGVDNVNGCKLES